MQTRKCVMGWMVAAVALLAAAPSARANYVQVTNVTLNAGGMVQFDLSWSNSWRQVWGSSPSIENWDAAWVFVKFRKAGDSSYSHATLSTTSGDHNVPSGAALSVGLTAGRTNTLGLAAEGVGVFIYREATSDWTGDAVYNGVQLKWLHEGDGVAIGANVDIQVHAIEMVYVPQGEFLVGSGGIEHGNFKNGTAAGSFLVNATWSEPSGSGAREIGNSSGKLWGNSTSGNSTISPAGTLHDNYPTGYSAFYCMKYEITQGQYAAFLNALMEAECGFTSSTSDNSVRYYKPSPLANRYSLTGDWPTIAAGKPYVACNFLSWADGAAYAAWAGLRPMTELEFEKACRGPSTPQANEFAWASADKHASKYTLLNEGLENESVNNASETAGNAVLPETRPDDHVGPLRAGVFATATSTRIQAGASYWGIMELSGNLRTRAVGVAANSAGNETKPRDFQGTHGSGTTALPADWPQNDAIGAGIRGGSFTDSTVTATVSSRYNAANVLVSRGSHGGSRGVRSAPVQ